MIDIIIPVFNEEEILRESREYYQSLSRHANVIFVDGESKDQTVERANELGKVIASKRGRGIQKNCGAEHAQADILLFLHVDTHIELNTLIKIEQIFNKENVCAGCLTQRVNDKRFIFRLIEIIINLRAKMFGVSDGDLGLFIKKDTFMQIKGFDTYSLMEDILIGNKIRKVGKFVSLPEPISVSSRKWDKQGFKKTLLEYSKAYIALWSRFRIIKGY